ncbi:MAG: putative Ig domain-containing protein [Acidobacteria bacterium]|nr:putative Ig domain-containing protein [Acidobacteriota bacterium]MBI3423235.1 putative Ig domain-containing protein [Acidobacteriota bacterium]
MTRNKRHSHPYFFGTTLLRGGLLAALLVSLLAGIGQTPWHAAAQQNERQAMAEMGGPVLRLEQPQNLAETTEEQKPANGLQNLMMAGSFLVDRLTDNNPGGGGEGAGFVGDLRFCLTQSNALGGNNTIDFSVAGTINLAGELPLLNNNVTINGPGASVLTVRRNSGGDYRIFTINFNRVVTISGLTITKGRVLPNGFTGGGGFFVNSGATLNLSNSVVTDNEGYSFGGGILSFGALNINNCTISFNKAGNGGGFYILFTTANITNSTVNNNMTDFQAGVGIQDSIVTLTNCTISNNSATTGGNGVVSRATSTTAATTLTNCTVANNSGPGAALWAIKFAAATAASLSVKNTLASANSPANFANSGGILASLGHNLDTDGTSGFANGLNGNIVGSMGAPINAQLAPLANNGGPAQTRALLCGSPAIDAGDNNGAPATDQRGSARPVGGAVDIGAYESTQICLGPLTDGQAGVPYNQTITVNGCSAPYNFAVVQGNLPPGLVLNPATGVVSGVATVVGTYSFTVQVTGSLGCTGVRSYTLTITCPTVTVNPASLVSGTLGAAYNQTVAAAPAGGNYVYAVFAGALPPGLSLNSGTGVISGTPAMTGQFGFVIQAAGFGACPGTASYTLTIAGQACQPITLSALANGTAGQFYYGNVMAQPAGSYTYAVTNGALPLGLVLQSMTGAVYGTPAPAGAYNFTISATNASGCTGSKVYSLTIAP